LGRRPFSSTRGRTLGGEGLFFPSSPALCVKPLGSQASLPGCFSPSQGSPRQSSWTMMSSRFSSFPLVFFSPCGGLRAFFGIEEGFLEAEALFPSEFVLHGNLVSSGLRTMLTRYFPPYVVSSIASSLFFFPVSLPRLTFLSPFRGGPFPP